MITIPEYVYNDNTIEFVCPALELSRAEAAWMRAVLTNLKWPDVLDELGYICHAFYDLGFYSTVVLDALAERYDYDALEGCLKAGPLRHEREEKRNRIAKHIRKAWCRHMRDHLEKTLKQG